MNDMVDVATRARERDRASERESARARKRERERERESERAREREREMPSLAHASRGWWSAQGSYPVALARAENHDLLQLLLGS